MFKVEDIIKLIGDKSLSFAQIHEGVCDHTAKVAPTPLPHIPKKPMGRPVKKKPHGQVISAPAPDGAVFSETKPEQVTEDKSEVTVTEAPVVVEAVPAVCHKKELRALIDLMILDALLEETYSGNMSYYSVTDEGKAKVA